MKKFYTLLALVAALSCSQSAVAGGENAKPQPESPATIELRVKVYRVGEEVRIRPDGKVAVTAPGEVPAKVLKEFQEVDRDCIDKERVIRIRWQELRNLADELGSVDPKTMRQRMQAAYSQLAILQTSAAAMQGRFGDVKGQLEVSMQLLKNVDKMEVSAADLDVLIHNDPVAEPLAKQVADLKMSFERLRRSQKPGDNAIVDQLVVQLRSAQEQYDQKLDELKEEARDKQRSVIEQDIIKFESYLASLQKSKAELTRQIEQEAEKAGKLGRSTVDGEMLRAEIKDLELAKAKMMVRREALWEAIRQARAKGAKPGSEGLQTFTPYLLRGKAKIIVFRDEHSQEFDVDLDLPAWLSNGQLPPGAACPKVGAQRADGAPKVPAILKAILESPGAKGRRAKAEAEKSADLNAKLDKTLERLDRLENEVKAMKASKSK